VSQLRIDDGDAYVWFAYDIGQQIDLDRAQQLHVAASERELIRRERRAPSYLQFRPAPLRLDDAGAPVAVGKFAADGRVEATLYDFGAVSFAYRIPIAGHDVCELHELAVELDDNPLLLRDSERRVRALIGRLGDAVRASCLADPHEDYTVFHVRRWSPAGDPAAFVDARREGVARVLRAEPQPMRASEVDDALQSRIAYGLDDELVIDWNGALLFDSLGQDTLAVLEFANVELLEMRFLDDRLDGALDRSHDVLRARRGRRPFWGLGGSDVRESMRRIAGLQLDNALLFESVNNAIKMIGDQFLARVYRLVARRFHLDDWDASILRKLETLDSIHSKLHEEQATRRMELLEWIIILLILVSIVLPFVAGAAH
jgi:hypothetical protein